MAQPIFLSLHPKGTEPGFNVFIFCRFRIEFGEGYLCTIWLPQVIANSIFFLGYRKCFPTIYGNYIQLAFIPPVSQKTYPLPIRRKPRRMATAFARASQLERVRTIFA